VLTQDANIWVHDPEGFALPYLGADAGTYWASNPSSAPGNRNLLKYDITSGQPRYTLVHNNGLVYEYDAPWTGLQLGTKYFLTKVKTPAGDTIASVAYGLPSPGGSACPNCCQGCDAGSGSLPSCSSGAPYIDTITAANGSVFKFVYKFVGGGTECVIDKVQAGSAGGPVDVVYYEYLGDTPGALSKSTTRTAGDAGLVEQYDYFDAGMRVTTPSGQTVFVYDNQGQVISMKSTPAGQGVPEEDLTFEWGKADGGVLITNDSIDDRWDGVKVQHAIDFSIPGPTEVELHRDTESSGSNILVCEAGREDHVWDAVSAGGMSIPYDKATQDKRSNYTSTTQTAGSLASFPQLLEVTSVKLGASDSAGSNAKHTSNYTYSYDQATNLQRVATASGSSAIDGTYTTTRTYGAGEELISEFTSGYTRQVDASGTAGTVSRTWGTVYVRHPSSNTGYCENDTSTTWVLETHGPCEVSGGSCVGTHPITQNVYSKDTATDSTRGQLRRVKKFPNGCGSAPVITEYLEYDAFGNLLRELAPNGAETRYTIDGPSHRTLTRTVAHGTSEAATTTFGYENGEQIWQQNPLGDYEVSCHRAGTSDACMGGTWSSRVQWRAKSASTTGTPFSEKVAYEYWNDGSLKNESYYSCTNAETSGCTSANQQLRRVKKYKPDADKRPSWEGMGSAGTPPVATKRRFDAESNMTALGLPLNGAPDNCDSAGAISKTCSELTYDSANRLESVLEYPAATDGTPVKTCYSYDLRGNVSRVVAGCQTSIACDGVLPTSCTDLAITYLYDDFGNLILVRMPDTGTSQRGVINYQYDPAGNLLKRQAESGATASPKWWYEYSYDQLGRKTAAYKNTATPSSTTLFTWTYDTTNLGACLSDNNGEGKLAYWADGYGAHYLGYDLTGRVTTEIHQRPDKSCTLDGLGNPVQDEGVAVTRYAYDLNGNPTTLTYPNGRPVVYTYHSNHGAKNRVSSIGVKTWTGSAWSKAPTTVISSIGWEPYGGLRSYQITAPNAPATPTGANNVAVEFLLDSSVSEQQSFTCSPTWRPSDTSDGTGRLRGLWVSRGQVGTGVSGDLLQRIYSWTADQLTTEDTCLLGSTTPRRLQYQTTAAAPGYDQLLRLNSAVRPDGNFAATGGPFAARAYTYDSRGNRTAEVHDSGLQNPAQSYSFTYSSSNWLKDQLLSRSDTLSALKHDYLYNADGQVYEKRWQNDSTGNPAHRLIFSYGPGAAFDPETPVFKAVGVNGSYYNYFYDAYGRRRLKQYPQSTPQDEYFYSNGSNQLLEDRGFYTTGTVSPYPMDEYLWLDGKAVAYIRSKHTLSGDSWVRETGWGSGSCSRNGDSVPCGIYFLVPDYLGKPVLAINSYRQVVGSADYDPFGYPNRASLRGETSHPYGNNQTISLRRFTQPLLGTKSQTRVKYHSVDTSTGDGVGLVNSGGTSLTANTGLHLGSIWTAWVTTPTDGFVDVKFYSNASGTAYGVITEAYEYRRWENITGLTWAWTPLRFPGQYYDAETDLFENWNRYYDPSIGRYLQPEPMLAMGPKDGDAPVYAYGSNNPLRFSDPTGLFIHIGDCANWTTALSVAQQVAGCSAAGTRNKCNACGDVMASCGACDVCKILQEGSPPEAYTTSLPSWAHPRDPNSFGTTTPDPGGQNWPGGCRVWINPFNTRGQCDRVTVFNILALADTMLHEALHVCKFVNGANLSDRLTDGCSPEDIAKSCFHYEHPLGP
jgi:RHS repeat-associated protein